MSSNQQSKDVRVTWRMEEFNADGGEHSDLDSASAIDAPEGCACGSVRIGECIMK